MTVVLDSKPTAWRRAGEVFLVFLKLGLTAFGGPIAHLGYFRQDLVTRRRWIGEQAYGEIVALCQFLPGPASSQTGFLLGLWRAGPLGALAAWLGFTLPSALIMLAVAYGSARLHGELAKAVIHGLKLVAIIVVAQAVWGMAQTLTPNWRRRGIALAAALVLALVGGAVGQIAAILIGAAGGLALCRALPASPATGLAMTVSRRLGVISLTLFVVLLVGLPMLAGGMGSEIFAIFYRAGALVFGGGHVVLPLLRADLVPTGLMTDDQFLGGYGAAQALPGPLFAIAAYLGAVAAHSPWGAVPALMGIFLPGLLIVIGVLPFWSWLRHHPAARAGVAGVNAAVVGILAWTLYDPLWTSGIGSIFDMLLVAAGIVALMRWHFPPIALVVMLVAASWAHAVTA
ncbi:chromate efflux transporter [Sphingomonas sanguinis]|jgi:chromate transporter|uniref:Chromate efflux transporter n=1 Tax=Sphingomonas sanguinis TaxID=33051 RepID=A0A7Y7URN4_9SPHN|nr:chromate efflux transporter [Sphingomonas sanguinis]MBZ6382859.1 chromate efflux transporter [Sphingomonas sanguinis]NNG51558.1 chromate efflux transporter [Sphingomonas sanguinis]NNG52413.1 chromate efflux transporter [Sphingomonas sanguinis]NVP32159.1 chromate efflux transporter [Sphingomonas sanguinis]